MIIARLPLWLCVAFVGALGAAGCGTTEPYVYKKDEFKRSAATFNKEPTDRDEVTICYNGQSATDQQAERMAQQECGKFAKQARAIDETFGDCPLMTPIEARFACVVQSQATSQ